MILKRAVLGVKGTDVTGDWPCPISPVPLVDRTSSAKTNTYSKPLARLQKVGIVVMTLWNFLVKIITFLGHETNITSKVF